jgi:hypothetical protein
MHAMVLLACMITIMIAAFVSSYDRMHAARPQLILQTLDIHYNIPIHYRNPRLYRVPEALPSAFYRSLGKADFTEYRTRQRSALGKELVYRV